MKNIPLKTMASVIILMTQLGATQALYAEDADTQQDNHSSVANTLDAEFASAISNRAGMMIEIIDQLREHAEAKGFEGWEKELTSALGNANNEAFLAAYNARNNYQAVVSALTGINFDKEMLINDYKAGGSPSLSGKAKSPVIAGRFGDLNKDLVYTPVTPCRILSTTGSNAGGKILAGTTRSFYADGPGSQLSNQGGDSNGCLLHPAGKDAFAYVFNITAHQVAGPGHLRIFPANKSNSITSIVNFIPGKAVANSSVVKTAYLTGKDFKIYAANDAHVIVDVMGYYDIPERTMPSLITVKARKTTTNKYYAFSTPACPANYRLISGGFDSDWYNVSLADSYIASNKWRCAVNNPDKRNSPVTCIGYCISIPGK